MKKDHRDSVVGPWAAQKLDALQSYLEAYCIALSKQGFRRVYIDAFAGSPVARIRSKDIEIEPNAFFEEEVDAQAQEEFVLGSPFRALQARPGFHEYHFFDLDESRAIQLGETLGVRPDVHISVGDCNPLIRQLAPSLSGRSVRGVAFLDPYGAHLEWDTLKALADTGTMEVIINFPVAMAINRLITKSGDIPEGWSSQLTACFGTDEWRSISYDTEVDLFGDPVISKSPNASDRLLDLYMRRLKTIFPHVSSPRLIKNTRNSPLYYLIWAGPHPLGLKIASHILKQGERLR